MAIHDADRRRQRPRGVRRRPHLQGAARPSVDGRVKLAAQTVAARRRSTPTGRGSTAATGSASRAGTLRAGRRLSPPTARPSHPSMLAGVTEPLAAAAKTPIGPDRRRASATRSRARRATSTPPGAIRVVNFPGGGAARIDNADVIGPGRRAGPRLRRQRRDLLLADRRPPHRRQYRDGRRRPAAGRGSRLASRAPARR